MWEDTGAYYDAIDSRIGNGDIWACMDLQAEMHDAQITGTSDLTIEATDNGYELTASFHGKGKTASVRLRCSSECQIYFCEI